MTTCSCLCCGGLQFVKGGLVGARTRVGVEAEDRGCVETASLVLTVGPGNTVIVRVCHNTDYQTYPEKQINQSN